MGFLRSQFKYFLFILLSFSIPSVAITCVNIEVSTIGGFNVYLFTVSVSFLLDYQHPNHVVFIQTFLE